MRGRIDDFTDLSSSFTMQPSLNSSGYIFATLRYCRWTTWLNIFKCKNVIHDLKNHWLFCRAFRGSIQAKRYVFTSLFHFYEFYPLNTLSLLSHSARIWINALACLRVLRTYRRTLLWIYPKKTYLLCHALLLEFHRARGRPNKLTDWSTIYWS